MQVTPKRLWRPWENGLADNNRSPRSRKPLPTRSVVVVHEYMSEDFTNAVKTIMGYCQNEDCDDDCKNCSNPLSVIRCGDEQGASDDVGTSIADSIRNMDNNTLAIYLHSWQTEDMSVEEIKELLCKENQT